MDSIKMDRPARPEAVVGERILLDLKPRYIQNQGALVGFSFDCPACPRTESGHVHSIAVFWLPCRAEGNPLWLVDNRENFHTINVEPGIIATGIHGCSFSGRIRDGVVTWPL